MKKKQRRLLTWVSVIVLIIALLCIEVAREWQDQKLSVDLTLDEAQALVNEAFDALADPASMGAMAIADRLTLTVKDLREGDMKNYFLTCTYESADVRSAVMAIADELLYPIAKDTSRPNGTKIKQMVQDRVAEAVKGAQAVSGEVEIELCESEKGTLSLFCSDAVVDACFGGILTLHDEIDAMDTVEHEGEVIDISKRTTLRTGLKNSITLINYDPSRPETSGPILSLWNELREEFYGNFIKGAKWEYLASGLLVTLELTLCSVLLGIVLGFLVAIVRTTHDRTGMWGLANGICKVYLSVIRGTPVMIQLLIIHFVILLPMGVPKFLSAVLCFGFNSGAYVAEIIRGGIMSVEQGQTEAGRSLGLNYAQTMIYIVIPQAFKAVLPSLANEFIVLLKESSVAFYVGVADLTQAGLKIRSITYSNFMPLLAVAFIYWVVVVILTHLVGILERRMRKSER